MLNKEKATLKNGFNLVMVFQNPHHCDIHLKFVVLKCCGSLLWTLHRLCCGMAGNSSN